MLQKILYGGNHQLRKSRLHDEKGKFVGWGKILSHGPMAISTGLLRLSVGYRPETPWIAYDAITEFKKFFNKNSRVLEFGSGMSTVWYSKMGGEVCSVEDYRPWFDKVDAVLEKRGISNINYQFASTPEEYFTFQSDDSEGFDLIMVDGSHRAKCVEHSVKLLRPGGILYLDNSDKHRNGGDFMQAEQHALDFAREKNAEITYFTDFAPTQLFVQEGMMVKTPK